MTRIASQPATTGELTYEQYMALPISKQKCEVVDGVLEVMPSPSYSHQEIVYRLGRAWRNFVDASASGTVLWAPADVLIRKEPKPRIRQPDLMLFTDARAGFRVTADPDRLQRDHIPPDVVAEVMSPGQNEESLQDKLVDYAFAMIKEVWLVDPVEKSVRILALGEAGYHVDRHLEAEDIAESALFPSLALDVASLFP